MPAAQLEDLGSGLTPVTQGWFIVNVRDAEWWFAESRGARCAFENEYGNPPLEFPQLGINPTVLEPGQTSLYHAEENQEAFLVLSATARAWRRKPRPGGRRTRRSSSFGGSGRRAGLVFRGRDSRG